MQHAVWFSLAQGLNIDSEPVLPSYVFLIFAPQ